MKQKLSVTVQISLGEYVKVLREREGLTISELADKIGEEVVGESILALEEDSGDVGISTIVAVSSYFGRYLHVGLIDKQDKEMVMADLATLEEREELKEEAGE